MNTSRMPRRLRLAAVAAIATVTLAACGSGSGAEAGKDFNDADVTFAQEMIPHHRQAVEMSTLAETRASDPDVKKLAATIKDAQDPEIETMTGWLEDWDAKVPSDSMGDMGGMDMGSMQGMVSEEGMAQLRDSTGAAFDRAFLTDMIGHHEGAVAMAETEITDGKNTDAIALAKQIKTSQTAEIAEMKALLDTVDAPK